MKRLLTAALVSAVALQAGCSRSTVRSEEAAEPPATAQPTLPAVELEPALLYRLLVAEFSAQQGALRLSAATYLDAAERTRDYRLARRATHIAIYARESSTALRAARLWVELNPESEEAHKSAAALLIAAGDNATARPHLERLLQGDNGYMLVATLLANDPEPQRALATMAELVDRAPEDPQALYAQAHLASQLEHHRAALGVLQQLLELQPEHKQGLLLQAQEQHALGDEEAALQSMEQVLRLDRDNQQLRMTYARMLVDARKLKRARQQFTILHQKDPNDADVVYALGLLALEAGDLDDAEGHFTMLLQHQLREEESRFAMAQIAEARQQPQKAIEWFSSIAQGERYLEAQFQAARLIADLHGVEQARQYLRELEIQNDEERVELYQAEAELLSAAGRHEEAMAIYDEGLKSFKDNEELLYARALTAEKIGRIDLLERDLGRILEQDPENARALNALGYTLADRTERYQEALSYIERAYQQQPDDVAVLDSMGWVLYKLGRLDEALNYLTRAAAMVRDGEIAAHLGEVLWGLGRQEQARHVWDEALKFAPDHTLLRQTIQRFNP